MHTRYVSSFAIASAVLMLLTHFEAAMSENYRVNLTFDQELDAGGQKVYSVRAGFQRDEIDNKIVAPNGHAFDFRNQYSEPLTTQEFWETAFGRWTAVTASSSIVFEIPDIGPDHMAFTTPVITSPAPGSEVPEEFTIEWQGEERGFVEVHKRTNLASRSSFHPNECCSTTLRNELVNPGKGLLELNVYERTILPTPQIISQVLLGTDTFTLQVIIRSHTPRVSYIVVPEPCGAMLIVMAGMAVLSIRHR